MMEAGRCNEMSCICQAALRRIEEDDVRTDCWSFDMF